MAGAPNPAAAGISIKQQELSVIIIILERISKATVRRAVCFVSKLMMALDDVAQHSLELQA